MVRICDNAKHSGVAFLGRCLHRRRGCYDSFRFKCLGGMQMLRSGTYSSIWHLRSFSLHITFSLCVNFNLFRQFLCYRKNLWKRNSPSVPISHFWTTNRAYPFNSLLNSSAFPGLLIPFTSFIWMSCTPSSFRNYSIADIVIPYQVIVFKTTLCLVDFKIITYILSRRPQKPPYFAQQTTWRSSTKT